MAFSCRNPCLNGDVTNYRHEFKVDQTITLYFGSWVFTVFVLLFYIDNITTNVLLIFRENFIFVQSWLLARSCRQKLCLFLQVITPFLHFIEEVPAFSQVKTSTCNLP